MKKILAIVAALSVVMSLVAGGTIAYLTDTKKATNTMTLGNVEIALKEQQFGDNGDLVDYVDGKPLFPIVNAPESLTNGYWDHDQVVDKIVTVEAGANSSDAYVRTIIAYEYDAESFSKIVINDIENSNDVTVTEHGVVEIDGADYMVYVYTYNNPLTKGNSTDPSLKQIYMNSTATNEDTAAFGETYDVLVLAQAVQTQGFQNANAAFSTSFQDGGDLTDALIQEWFAADDDSSDDDNNDNTGDDNTGDDNTGDDNTGDDNTGDDNTGDDNTGDDEPTYDPADVNQNGIIDNNERDNYLQRFRTTEGSGMSTTTVYTGMDVTFANTPFNDISGNIKLVDCDIKVNSGNLINMVGNGTVTLQNCNITFAGSSANPKIVSASTQGYVRVNYNNLTVNTTTHIDQSNRGTWFSNIDRFN